MSAEVLSRKSPVPLYRQLAGVLVTRIEAGVLRPGAMTSEQELIEAFGVSRITVRQALDQLVRDGRIFKIHGKGTFIAERPKLEPQSALTSFTENMAALGLRPTHKTYAVDEVAADYEVANGLQVIEGAKVLRIHRLLLADDMPMAVMEGHLPAWVYRRGRDRLTVETLDECSMYSLLEGDLGVALWKARETVECARAGDYGAQLGMDADDLVLLVQRLTLTRDERAVEYTRLRYRADLYRYQVELYRHGSRPLTPPSNGGASGDGQTRESY